MFVRRQRSSEGVYRKNDDIGTFLTRFSDKYTSPSQICYFIGRSRELNECEPEWARSRRY